MGRTAKSQSPRRGRSANKKSGSTPRKAKSQSPRRRTSKSAAASAASKGKPRSSLKPVAFNKLSLADQDFIVNQLKPQKCLPGVSCRNEEVFCNKTLKPIIRRVLKIDPKNLTRDQMCDLLFEYRKLNQEIISARQKQSRLRTRLREKEEEREDLKRAKCRIAAQKNKDIRALNEQIAQLERDNRKLMREIKKSAGNQQEVDKLTKSLERRDKALRELRAERKRFIDAPTVNEVALKHAEKQIANREKEIKAVAAEEDHIKKEIVHVEVQKAKLEQEVQPVQEDLSSKEAELNQIERNRYALEERLEQLEREMEEKEVELRVAQFDKEQRPSKQQELRDEIERKKKILQILRAKRDKQDPEYYILHINRLEKVIRDKNNVIEESERRIKEIEKVFENQEKLAVEVVMDLKQELENAFRVRNNARSKLLAVETELESIRSENFGLLDQVSQMEREIRELKREAAKVAGLEQQVRDSEDAVTHLSTLRSEFESKEQELTSVLRAKQELEADYAKAQREVAGQRRKIAELEREVGTLQASLQTVKRNKDEIQAEKDKLGRKALSIRNVTYSISNDSSIDIIQDEIRKLENEIEEQKKKEADLATELGDVYLSAKENPRKYGIMENTTMAVLYRELSYRYKMMTELEKMVELIVEGSDQEQAVKGGISAMKAAARSDAYSSDISVFSADPYYSSEPYEKKETDAGKKGKNLAEQLTNMANSLPDSRVRDLGKMSPAERDILGDNVGGDYKDRVISALKRPDGDKVKALSGVISDLLREKVKLQTLIKAASSTSNDQIEELKAQLRTATTKKEEAEAAKKTMEATLASEKEQLATKERDINEQAEAARKRTEEREEKMRKEAEEKAKVLREEAEQKANAAREAAAAQVKAMREATEREKAEAKAAAEKAKREAAEAEARARAEEAKAKAPPPPPPVVADPLQNCDQEILQLRQEVNVVNELERVFLKKINFILERYPDRIRADVVREAVKKQKTNFENLKAQIETINTGSDALNDVQNLLSLEGKRVSTEQCNKVKSKLSEIKKITSFLSTKEQNDILSLFEDVAGIGRVYVRMFGTSIKPGINEIAFPQVDPRTKVITGDSIVVRQNFGGAKDSYYNFGPFTKVFHNDYLTKDERAGTSPRPTNNISIYEDSVKSAVESNLDLTVPYNIVLLVYGQSGSGKTHTLNGASFEPGIVYRVLETIVNKCRTLNCPPTIETAFVQFFLDYNGSGAGNAGFGQKADFFITPEVNSHSGSEFDGQRLKLEKPSESEEIEFSKKSFANIFKDEHRLVVSPKNFEYELKTKNGDIFKKLKYSDLSKLNEELNKVIENASYMRPTRGTAANADSSRSHLFSMFRITFGGKKFVLTFIDLGGNEDTSKKNNHAKFEGNMINNSLIGIRSYLQRYGEGFTRNQLMTAEEEEEIVLSEEQKRQRYGQSNVNYKIVLKNAKTTPPLVSDLASVQNLFTGAKVKGVTQGSNEIVAKIFLMMNKIVEIDRQNQNNRTKVGLYLHIRSHTTDDESVNKVINSTTGLSTVTSTGARTAPGTLQLGSMILGETVDGPKDSEDGFIRLGSASGARRSAPPTSPRVTFAGDSGAGTSAPVRPAAGLKPQQTPRDNNDELIRQAEEALSAVRGVRTGTEDLLKALLADPKLKPKTPRG